MYFLELAETFERMEKTTSRLELTEILVTILKKTPKKTIEKLVYLIQGKLGPDYIKEELGIAEKLVIKSLAMASGHSTKDIQSKYNTIGDLGQVGFEILKNKLQTTLFYENLTIERVFEILKKITKFTGSGSIDLKLKYINSLLNNASNLESKYILKLILGNLRLGIADFTILDAISLAFTGDKKNRKILERAFNLSSDLGKIAFLLYEGDINRIQSIQISAFIPVRPMLAERASNAKEALDKMNFNCLAEYKIDGERIQVHKKGERIELFTRSLEDITNNFPEIIEEFKKINLKDIIGEGEIVSIDPITKKFKPFQDLMHRKRKYNIDDAVIKYPVILNFFDILFYDGKDKTILPFSERRKLLEMIFKQNKSSRIKLVTQIKANSVNDIEKFMSESISAGCEGLMIKNPNSQYRAGAREWAWIKLKKEYEGEFTDSLDLTIVGALHGKGRRAGNYGTFLLACYDHEEDVFYTICKVGTGFTDELLKEISTKLKQHLIKFKHPRIIAGQIKMDIWFEPKVVIEIISSEITLSPVYTTYMNKIKEGYGLALRFPKFTGKIREDKNAEDSTTVSEIIEMYKKQIK